MNPADRDIRHSGQHPSDSLTRRRLLAAASSLSILPIAQGLLIAPGVQAAPSPIDNALLLGQSCAFDGPMAGVIAEAMAGASWYFGQVNDAGGVHGRPIRVISLDDGYVAHRCAANVRTLVDKHSVLALFNVAGTPTALAAVPVARELKVPLVAPFTGTDLLRRQLDRYVFNVRAGFADELDKIVEHLITIGIREAAVAYLDNPFGTDGLASLTKSANARGLTISAKASLDVAASTLQQAVATVAGRQPKAVILVMAGSLPGDFIAAYRHADLSAQFYTLSVVSPKQLVERLGERAIGVAIAQAMPSATSGATGLGRELGALAEANRVKEPTPNHMEGYVAAKVMVEALRRAGKAPTPEGIVYALEGMTDVDLGGLRVRFSNRNHNGSSFVEMTVIGSLKRLIR